ncbi:MAG TPA: DEAD/DEAH box helicase [Gemmatimonadaceae bacterium]|nr:DEAD/DEAH box helicase [Gemmatimonadaceae bacterium]
MRCLIARNMLDSQMAMDDAVGGVTLRPHQRNAAARLARLISANGGALLAEPVGLGKTYISLAVAAHSGRPITIAAPAALRDMWCDALERCRLSATIVTHEALSRGVKIPPTHGFVIVDEAHRLRSPSTNRYTALADVCRRARVLLVTATPVQNRRRDLAAQLALYVGRRAWQMSDDELAEHVVRGASPDMHGMPRLDGPRRVTLDTQDDCLDELLALPPPIPARDETVVVALLTYGLVHQWTSSRAALVASLERRRARGLALLSAIDSGRQPTRAELSAWTHAGDAMQLAFPELVTSQATRSDVDAGAVAVEVDRHVAAIESLLRRVRNSPDPDDERADALRRIRDAHPGERIIAFCHYAETVNALRSRLARDGGVAALTANGARIASGRVSRDVVLEQFAPMREGAREIGAASRIDLLITTDLLSEGLNLQRASVIVHLDLPWNPARLDQRVGRARRLGSRHETVSVYIIAPPAAADRLLRVEERLREKLSVAQRTVGVAGQILPSPIGASAPQPGLAEQTSAIHARLRTWIVSEENHPELLPGMPVVAGVESDVRGFLALVRDDDGPHLIVNVGSGITTAADAVARGLIAAEGFESTVGENGIASVLRQIDTWLAARRGASAIDFQAAAAARVRRAALTRVARTLARAPRHQRAMLAPLADTARAIATAPLAEGAERILETLVRAELPDEAWLRSIATFGELNARPLDRHRRGVDAVVIALILLRDRS